MQLTPSRLSVRRQPSAGAAWLAEPRFPTRVYGYSSTALPFITLAHDNVAGHDLFIINLVGLVRSSLSAMRFLQGPTILPNGEAAQGIAQGARFFDMG
jgi:hypothetical protein